jgi:hypothetical protein
MAKHARIKRLRAEREAAKDEEKARGPVSETDAVKRAREWTRAGLTRGHWALGSRTGGTSRSAPSSRTRRQRRLA